MQVKGSLGRFRDLINIDDVVQGWDQCLHSRAYNQVFNLGTGKKTTFETLIRALATVMGKGIDCVSKNCRARRATSRDVSPISLAPNMLGSIRRACPWMTG